MKHITFSRIDKAKFLEHLIKESILISKKIILREQATGSYIPKQLLCFSLYLVPFILLLTVAMPNWLQLILTAIIGVGMAGVGMNVMHESNHESFSSKKWVNKLMGSSMYMLAGNVFNWKVQHNVLHHTFTNIKDHDEDIDA